MQHVQRMISTSQPVDPNNRALRTVRVALTDTGTPEYPDSAEVLMMSALGNVFRVLERANIPYCVLRNRESIPSALVRGSDVDIVVPNGTSSQKLVQLLAHLEPIQIVLRREVLSLYLPAGQHILHVDLLYRDQEWLGARYQANDAILRNVWVDRGVPVASLSHQAFFGWFHSLLWGGFFKRRYVELINHAVHTEPSALRSLLGTVFGPKLGKDLWTIAEAGNLVDSERLSRKVRNEVFLAGLRRHPLSTLAGWVDHFRTELSLLIRPNGLSVAILGPDGAGKSTICSYLANVDAPRFAFTGVAFEHLYRPVLPSPSNLRHFRLSGPSSMINPDPHGQPVHGPLLSLLRMAYFTLDQWLSECVYGRRLLARNVLRLHDRHLVEISVDPIRYRFGLPARIIERMAHLAPQPDLVILLDVSPDTLRKRKAEVSDQEVVRQCAAYRELIASMGNGVVIDGEAPVDQVAKEVRSIVHRETALRTRRRFLRAGGV